MGQLVALVLVACAILVVMLFGYGLFTVMLQYKQDNDKLKNEMEADRRAEAELKSEWASLEEDD